MIHPELAAIAALLAVGLIACCALMGRLDKAAPGDYERGD